MNKTKHFKRTAFPLSAKSMVSTLLLLIAMLMPQGAWAISGSGTSSSPYLIANEADLRTFQQYVENGNSGIYGELTADITLTSAWTRIGRADRKFTGYFDGQGHTISGMNLSFTAYEHGFFGFVNNATIKNFTLTGTMTSSANGNHSHGTVVGSAAGTTVIENVTSSVNLTLNHTGFTCIGGIVGHMDESSKVIGCTYTGTINLNKDSEQVGGIVGYAQRNLYITNNVFSGTITSTGTCKYLAGIAGKTDGTIEVSGCTNIGTINGGPSYDCVAGIVGYVQYQSQALITNCYFGGSLSSTSSGTSLGMGGILGAVNDDAGTNFRGLTYCFSDGTLTATNSSSTQIGGIAGVIKSKAVSKVMNNTYLSGTASRLAAISNNSSSFDSSNKAITISVTAGTGGTVKKSYIYPTSTTATQLQVVATPNSGYHYVEWSDNGAQTHNVSLANNVSLTATFGAHTYGDWTTDVAATCTSAGTHHRVCTHTGCGAREDGTIAALGHSYTSQTTTDTYLKSAATCTDDAVYYHKCSRCDSKGSTTWTKTGTALGHIYSPGSWSWAGDGHSATCTRTCFRCTTNTTGHTSSKSVTLGNGITSFQGVAPTCNAMGMTHYTAIATVEGTQYSATKDVLDIAALGHSYGAGAWSWADDGHSATCTRTCDRTRCYTNTPGHTSSKSVTLGNGITSAQQVAPNCTTKGTTRYTATATVEGTQYSDTKDVVDIAALDHDYSQVVDEDYLVSAATCGSDAVYHEKCSRCDTHGAEWTVTGTATGNHSYTNNTLTASPIEDGLYAYACDNGCGTHNDAHVIKDFNGEGNHLELTKDGEGNYSTSEDIIINESDFYYSPVDFSLPVDFTAASVTFNRYFVNDGGMYSFIVPFDIPAAQAAELGKFYQYSKHEEGKVYFDDITKIDNADGIVRANTAYFFEPAKDIPSITVENPTFGTTGTMPDATNPSEPGLYGTYSQIDIPVGAYGYMMQHGVSTFVKADTGNLLRPFRAYLWLGSGASMAKACAFFGDYDDITGINNIETGTDLDMSKPIYTLSGQRITTPKKGEIYIQNGKKVMKK